MSRHIGVALGIVMTTQRRWLDDAWQVRLKESQNRNTKVSVLAIALGAPAISSAQERAPGGRPSHEPPGAQRWDPARGAQLGKGARGIADKPECELPPHANGASLAANASAVEPRPTAFQREPRP
jgi:hypothetical protein